MDLLNNLDKCTGCTACANICAKVAITMLPDKLGFLYPSVEKDRCVECGLCDKICPKKAELTYSVDGKTVLYGISNDEDTIMTSSSGGAFTELVKLVEQNNIQFHCYAATFKDGLVKHTCINSTQDLLKQKKSKYTQSILSDTFRCIKEDLKQNMFVVFVGTPCQVDGLNSYLFHKHYPNLLTIDLLCTGSCSPALLENHTNYLEQKHKQQIVGYDMRKKEYVEGKWHIMNTEIAYQNGQYENEEKNLFVGCFRQHVALRTSCYQCKYTDIRRTGDITLGDYWKQNQTFCSNEFRGISVIISNTEQGCLWAEKLKHMMRLKETTIDDIRSQQPALRNPVLKPKFVVPDNIETIEGSLKFMKRYYRAPLKIRLLSTLSHMMPKNLSLMLKKVYYNINKVR